MKTVYSLRLFFQFFLCYLGSIACSLARYTAVDPMPTPLIYTALKNSSNAIEFHRKTGLSLESVYTCPANKVDKIFNVDVAADGTTYIAYRHEDGKIMLSKESAARSVWSSGAPHSWDHKQINTDDTFTFDYARVKCSTDGTPHLLGYSKALGIYFYQKGELLCPVYKVPDANKNAVRDNLHLQFASSDAKGEEPFFAFDDGNKALSCQLKKTDTRILKSNVKAIATLGGSKQFLMTLDPSNKPAFLVPTSTTQFKVIGENFEESLKKSLGTTTIAPHQSITLSGLNGVPVGFALTLDEDQTDYTLASGSKLATFRAYVPTIFIQYPSKALVKLIRTPSLWKLNEHDTSVKNRNGWSEEISLSSSFIGESIAFCTSNGVLYATSAFLAANKIISDPTVNAYVEDILNKKRLYAEKLNTYNTHNRVYNAVQSGFSSYFQRLNDLCQSIASDNSSFVWPRYQTLFQMYTTLGMWPQVLTQINDNSSGVYRLITTHPYANALSIIIFNAKNIFELEVAHRKILAAHVKRMWNYSYNGVRTISTQLFNKRSEFVSEYTKNDASQPFRNRGTTTNCHQWLSWKAGSMVAELAFLLEGNTLTQGHAPAGIRCELFGAMYYSLVQNISYVFDKAARTPTSYTAQSLASELYKNLISDADFFLKARGVSSSDPNRITGYYNGYFSLAGHDLTIDGHLRRVPQDFVSGKLTNIRNALHSAYTLNSSSLSNISTAESSCSDLVSAATEGIKPLKLIDPTWNDQGLRHVYDHPTWAAQHAYYGIAWLVKDYLLAGARWAYNIWNQEGSNSVKGFPCLDEVNAIKTEVDQLYSAWNAAETQLKNYLKGQ